MIKIAPSILSADFANLQRDISSIKSADYIHIDVMDGHFVPNITIGAPVVSSLRKITDKILDVHLMIENPIDFIKDFADSGSDIITFHIESKGDTFKIINEIKKYDVKVGISIKPNTDISDILKFLSQIDMVLIMTVEPGFGGQGFIPHTMEKIKFLRKYIDDNKLNVLIEIDGGAKLENCREIAQAGTDIIVAGSAIFNTDNPDNTIMEFKNKCQNL